MSSLSTELLTKGVRRNNKYNDVVQLLVYGDSSSKVFNNIKDLIIMSAMVGKRLGVREDLESENTPITLLQFSGSGTGKDNRVDQHNIIFMFGLIESRDMNYIRDENIMKTIEIFEKYSNGGLSVIRGWLEESAWNAFCLIDKIVDVLESVQPKGIQVDENPF